MGGVVPPTLPNAVLPQIHTQEGLEVQMQRNESKCCPMTLGQGRVIADSAGLGHRPTRDFQAKTSCRTLDEKCTPGFHMWRQPFLVFLF